jgi:sialate O-acetylesterase
MIRTLTSLALLLLPHGAWARQDAPKRLPPEDVVDVPAVGPGLSLSNVFQTRMVLQRDKPLAVWGWADPGESVEVAFGGKTATAVAGPDRAWKAVLDPLPADRAPRTLTVKGKNRSLELTDVLVGDVWLLGGQSNMEFPIDSVDDGPLEIASANFPELRLLTLPQGRGFDSVRSFERLQEWSSWSGRHYRKGDWEACTPRTVQEFSAIGYVFGRRLQMASQVPIGLIDASIGGTTVETWTPEEVVRRIEGPETKAKVKAWDEKIAAYDPQEDLKRRLAKFEEDRAKGKTAANAKPPAGLLPGPAADRNRPGYCYASVIRPLEGLAIKGALWHQGYNNCFEGSAGGRMYYQIFGKLIAAWRAAFGDPKLPFCILSLCTADQPQTQDNFSRSAYDAGPYVREAHFRTFLDFRAAGDGAVGYASTFDLRKSWYHPQIKIPAGERAAKWALSTQYGLLKEEHWLPPSIREVQRTDGALRLTMSTEIRLKDDSDDRMRGFAIAGEDRRFHPAEVRYLTDGVDARKQPVLRKNVLVLSSPLVPRPVHYRYAWARNPMGNLVSPRQIPLPAQRSDDWPLEETPTRYPGSDDPAQERRLRGLLVKELELLDVERRIREAEAVLAELKPRFAAEQEAWEKRKASELQKAGPEKNR